MKGNTITERCSFCFFFAAKRYVMRESVRESNYRTWRWSVGRPFVCQVALLQLRSRVFYFSCVLCCVMFFCFFLPLMTALSDRSLCCSPHREAAEKHTDWGGRPESGQQTVWGINDTRLWFLWPCLTTRVFDISTFLSPPRCKLFFESFFCCWCYFPPSLRVLWRRCAQRQRDLDPLTVYVRISGSSRTN